MAGPADVRGMVPRRRGGQEDQGRVTSGVLIRSPDQLATDPLLLPGDIDGKVRELRAVREVRDRPRHSHEPTGDPRHDDHPGIGQLRLDRCRLIDGTLLRQCRADEQIDELPGMWPGSSW